MKSRFKLSNKKAQNGVAVDYSGGQNHVISDGENESPIENRSSSFDDCSRLAKITRPLRGRILANFGELICNPMVELQAKWKSIHAHCVFHRLKVASNFRFGKFEERIRFASMCDERIIARTGYRF